MPNTTPCLECGTPLPRPARGRPRARCAPCDRKHRNRSNTATLRRRRWAATDPRKGRRGPDYPRFSETTAPQLWDGILTIAEAAKKHNVSAEHIRRWMITYTHDQTRLVPVADPAVETPIGLVERFTHIRRLTGHKRDTALEGLVADFVAFRNRYFQTETGERYETRDFHQRWIKAIVECLVGGGQQMILSPPRHGKTELLVHFAVWLIVGWPNVRIMWVGGNEDIAKLSLLSVMDQLTNNEPLVADYQPPDSSFRPQGRSGKLWSAGQFTVSTRTVSGIKAPTIVAVGRGGKILSRDTDLIVCDDIEDHNSTSQPGAREQTRYWMTTTLGSRKEAHTAIVVIGSRQHSDDLYGHLLDNPSWASIVESAHDLGCTEDEHLPFLHTDCMLWPIKRDYGWLLDRQISAETTGGRHTFDMVYLNVATVEGWQTFPKTDLAAARNPQRSIGQPPDGLYLCAGLDPAASGYQAAWLWGFDLATPRMLMLDIENRQGGGIRQAAETMRRWHDTYGLAHWVIEENNFQKAIRLDPDIKSWSATHGVVLDGHQTHANKWDNQMGVTRLAVLFAEGLIDLPYGDPASRAKTDQAVRQFLHFSTATQAQTRPGAKYRSDLVMAAWFPLKIWVRMLRSQNSQQKSTHNQYEPSYAAWQPTYTGTGLPWS